MTTHHYTLFACSLLVHGARSVCLCFYSFLFTSGVLFLKTLLLLLRTTPRRVMHHHPSQMTLLRSRLYRSHLYRSHLYRSYLYRSHLKTQVVHNTHSRQLSRRLRCVQSVRPSRKNNKSHRRWICNPIPPECQVSTFRSCVSEDIYVYNW